jgi:paraquat-inducible protein B
MPASISGQLHRPRRRWSGYERGSARCAALAECTRRAAAGEVAAPALFLCLADPFACRGHRHYLGYRTYLEQGPELTISFANADGLSAGQTQVKYKAVALGTVEGIDLSSDNSHVIVRVRMNNVGKRFLTTHARFWVEGAHVSLTDPSSLGSFVSGAYIGVDPGAPGGRYLDHFVGLSGPPGVRSDVPGRTYTLTVNQIGALRTGSPVLFRDVDVGEVLNYNIGNGLGPVQVSIFVRAPYDDFVRPDTHFWNISGISLDIQPGQFHVELESLAALLSGGVAFNLPPQATNSAPSPDGATFPMYASKEQADAASYAQLIPAVAYFHSSVAGLAVGSPVDILGMQVGVVTSVNLVLDPVSGEEKVRVGMTLQPERNAHQADFETDAQTYTLMQKFINRGMRAEVGTSSYITGQKLISFTIVKNTKPVKLMKEGDAYVVPSQDSDVDSALASVSDIAAKIDKMPLQQIGDNLNTLLKTANNTIGGPQTKQAIASLNASLKSLAATLNMLNQDYGNDSDFQHDLYQLMQQSNAALGSIKQLSDYLDRHPNALLLGRGSGQ